MGDGTLSSGQHSEVSGVDLVLWQSGEGLLDNWVFLVDQVIELETHLTVAGVSAEELGSWNKDGLESWGSEDEVTGLDDGGVGSHCGCVVLWVLCAGARVVVLCSKLKRFFPCHRPAAEPCQFDFPALSLARIFRDGCCEPALERKWSYPPFDVKLRSTERSGTDF